MADKQAIAKLLDGVKKFRQAEASMERSAESALMLVSVHVLMHLKLLPNRFDKDGPWERMWTIPELLKLVPELGLDEVSLMDILHWCCEHKETTDVEWYGNGYESQPLYKIPAAPSQG